MKPPQSWSRADSAVALISVITLALITMPYLWGRALAPEGYVYSGFAYVLDDSFSYLAKMRQGYDGRWLYQNLYTTDGGRPAALFEFYLFLGHVGRIFRLNPTFAMHLARVIGSAFLLFSWDRFLRALRFQGRERALAFFLGVFGGGLGWVLWATKIDTNPMEFWFNEAHGLSTMLVFAHFSWSSAFILVCLTDWFLALGQRKDLKDPKDQNEGKTGGRPEGRGGWGPLVRLGVCAFLLAWVHPRMILTVVAVGSAMTGLGALWRLWHLRRMALPLIVALAAGGFPMAVMVLSYRGDPVWEAWAQTTLPRPDWVNFLSLFGLMWPLAAWGCVIAWRSRSPWGAALLAWGVIGFFLPWLPVASSRRLFQAYGFPLAALSMLALYRGAGSWIERACGRRSAGAFLAGAALFLAITPLFHWAYGFREFFGKRYPWFYSETRQRALDWLRDNTAPDATVLSSTDSGLLIPAYAGRRVVIGHWAETLDVEAKWNEDVRPFFANEMTSEQRLEMLNRHGVDYLFYSASERRIGPYAPENDPGMWKLVWTTDGIYLFERLR